VLLVCAALFVQSMRNVSQLDLGFRTDNRLTLAMDPALGGYDEARGRHFFENLLQRVRALPGVLSASTASSLPIGFNNSGSEVFARGQPSAPEERKFSLNNAVDTEYFTAMGIPILQGRAFAEEDAADTRGVAVVNQTLAEELWPGQDPLGRQLSTESPEGPFLTVIGVARNGKYNLPGESPQPYLYLPAAQSYRSERTLLVHTRGEPTEMLPPVRREIRALDPEMALFDVRSMETHIRQGKGAFLFQVGSGLVGSFGLIGILVAAVGLYGLMAYSVSRRTHEIGVRLALGATRSRIVAMVMRRALVLAGLGSAAGLAFAFAFTGSLSNLLVGWAPRTL
jgi:predicted permease